MKEGEFEVIFTYILPEDKWRCQTMDISPRKRSGHLRKQFIFTGETIFCNAKQAVAIPGKGWWSLLSFDSFVTTLHFFSSALKAVHSSKFKPMNYVGKDEFYLTAMSYSMVSENSLPRATVVDFLTYFWHPGQLTTRDSHSQLRGVPWSIWAQIDVYKYQWRGFILLDNQLLHTQ